MPGRSCGRDVEGHRRSLLGQKVQAPETRDFQETWELFKETPDLRLGERNGLRSSSFPYVQLKTRHKDQRKGSPRG